MDSGEIAVAWIGLAGVVIGILLDPMRKSLADHLFGPKLAVFFDQTSDECNALVLARNHVMVDGYAVVVEGSERFQRYIRMRITNNGESPAIKCRVALVGLKRFHEDGTPHAVRYVDSIPLQWSFLGPSNPAIDLVPGVPHFVNLIFTEQGESNISHQLVSHPYKYETLFEGNGRYLFDLLIAAENTKPLRRRIEFHWFGQWDTFSTQEIPIE